MKLSSQSVWSNPQLQIHFCVVMWGFTAILGKLITLAALPLVFWRVLIVSLCLLCWLPLWRQLLNLSRRDWMHSLVAGILITLHWLCFYGSIKLANASVAATCIALAPVFLSIIEPLLSRQPFVAKELLVALISIPGVMLVVGGIPSAMLGGFALGTLSSLLVAIFSILNKRLAMRVPALSLTAIEMSAGALLLGVLIPVWPLLGATFDWPGQADLQWLLVLALACTLLPFVVAIVALRKLSAFSAQLAVNLEPVYAIILAWLFLGEGEQLRLPFYAGVAVILAAVLVHVRFHTVKPV
ncbi:MAG: DMT family transporter [Proteobacteria bacterium]|nr:DMT family transporter [Pseudomonadota bacterium]